MEQRDDVLTVIWVSIACGVLFGIAVGSVVCWFLSKWNARIPPSRRALAPWQIWILLVLVFGVIGTLLVYPGMASSFDAHVHMENQEAVGLAILYAMAILWGTAPCLMYLAILAFFCWLLSSWLKRIPEAHRKQTPGKIWLLMIPLFNLFWSFMVFQKISESFDSYFKAKGEAAESTVKLAQIFCILCVGAILISFVPFLGLLGASAGLAALVILIILLVKYNDLKNRIPQA